MMRSTMAENRVLTNPQRYIGHHTVIGVGWKISPFEGRKDLVPYRSSGCPCRMNPSKLRCDRKHAVDRARWNEWLDSGIPDCSPASAWSGRTIRFVRMLKGVLNRPARG